MSIPKQGKAVPWSYSSLTAYETCPRRFYLTKITKKVTEPQTEATVFGNKVHKALEDYVGGLAPLPGNMAQYQPVADKIKATPGKKMLEYSFGLTKALTPTTFFGSDVWVRGKLDVSILRPKEAIVLDYKTGKRKFDMDQLKLFAAVGFALWPYAERSRTGYVWLPENTMDREEFTPDQKPIIFAEFASRVRRMELSQENNEWPARPSGLCKKWCPVGKENCEFCGE